MIDVFYTIVYPYRSKVIVEILVTLDLKYIITTPYLIMRRKLIKVCHFLHFDKYPVVSMFLSVRPKPETR